MEQDKFSLAEIAEQTEQNGMPASCSEKVELRNELRMLRKELQTLNACFNTSAGKLSALIQQQGHVCDQVSRQGQQIQHLCRLMEAADRRQSMTGKRPPSYNVDPVSDLQANGSAECSDSLPPIKRKRSEQEKEAAREVTARLRAAEQLKERVEAGQPIPVLQPGVVVKVYPGKDGTPQWTGNWEGQFATTCDYPSIRSIWQEWESGILYKNGMQQTVPLAQLEEDLAFKRSVWRRSKKLRNRLHAMKTIVYHVIRQSSRQSRPVGDIVSELDLVLGEHVAETKSQKAMCTLALERIKSEEGGWLKPSQFETNFLKWPTSNERKKLSTAVAAESSPPANSDSD